MKPIRISAGNNFSNSQVRSSRASVEDKFLIMKMFMGLETDRLNTLLREKNKEIEGHKKDLDRNMTELSKVGILQNDLALSKKRQAELQAEIKKITKDKDNLKLGVSK